MTSELIGAQGTPSPLDAREKCGVRMGDVVFKGLKMGYKGAKTVTGGVMKGGGAVVGGISAVHTKVDGKFVRAPPPPPPPLPRARAAAGLPRARHWKLDASCRGPRATARQPTAWIQKRRRG